MLAVLGDYLKQLNSEIESIEQLIATKRQEAQKLTQLQGQVVEALGLLKGIVDELNTVDPNAIATVKTATLQIFDNGSQSEEDLSTDNGSPVELKPEKSLIKSEKPVESTDDNLENLLDSTDDSQVQLNLELLTSQAYDSGEIQSDRAEDKPNYIRLSENVVYNQDEATAYAGINAYNRAKAWGEWLCFTHTVGEQFKVINQSRSEGYSYDLIVFGIQSEDAHRLAQADLSKQPSNSENASWQPTKRHPLPTPPKPQVCQPGDLAVGDIARKADGREYQVIGVSDDGSVVKVVNEDNMEMAFAVGALYLVKKALKNQSESDPNLTTVTEAFSNGKTHHCELEIGTEVLIHSSRYQGKYEGRRGVVAAEPTNLGVKIDIDEEVPIFFLNGEISVDN
ncbi:hypothetical protein PCC7424_2400 [Gloeothece citriformis PCC 7424]|uniref:Uncharacterized protein n=1 Tax=Gloeothece citriformis (strain PCC 7424) TaxID=65393 RepID=B7KIY5_GLOC7|nr:hypothetical protein [Gloeothece citriformis]ACK70821.1 hypothetical protein PCC7424_2400 [Gloeothece citriformis PCC 7424]